MAKKVLLLYPPILQQVAHINISAFDKVIGNYPPLGLLYLATYLKQQTDYDVEILDCCAEGLGFAEIREKIEAEKPDLLGISAMTHFFRDVVKIADLAKGLFPELPVVVGGPHTSIYPVSTVKQHPGIDYTICGEGEICFTELVTAIFQGKTEVEIADIPGVASKLHVSQHKHDCDIPPQRIADLDSIPYPDRSLLDNHKYFSVFAGRGSFTTLMSSRGCPFHCIYCDRLGKAFRAVSAENILKEIRACLELGISNFFFHDDTFTINKKRVQALCERLIQEGMSISWEARSRVDCVDYDLLETMKRAGLSRISFGVESGNEKILVSLKKGIRLEQVVKVFEWCRQLKITTLADFMIGSPGEGLKEIRDTIQFVKKLRPDYVQFSITCPYPATELYSMLLDEGKIADDVWLQFVEQPDRDFDPPLATDAFTRDELERLVAKAYRSVYFSLPFILKELKKIRSWEMLLARIKTTFSLVKR